MNLYIIRQIFSYYTIGGTGPTISYIHEISKKDPFKKKEIIKSIVFICYVTTPELINGRLFILFFNGKSTFSH